MKVLLNLISSSLSHSLSYSLSSSVAHLGNYLVLIIICIILVAAIIILGITFFTNYAVKNAVKKKTPPPPKSTIVKEKIVPLYRLPLWGGRLSQFLTLKGFFRVGDIGLSFLRALAFLRERLDNLTYKYQLPWYFMVGAGNSGKSTLLEHAGMSLPVGMPNLGIDDAHPPCRWWFYNRAVILDIQGSLVIGEHKTTSEERAWRSILSLLARYRSKRPLDGIILTISATELYGHEKLSPENLNARAKFLGQKLITAQHFLGIRLPVYVVVTKCDVLPGFQSFCHELPVAHRNNILGWSVPYALHTAFTSQWIDEAFQTIHENLSSVRLEMFVQGTAPENADGIFILDQEFSLLKGGLKLYLDHIFKNSAYEASLMLRGIYFCGDSGIQHLPASINMSENLETQNEDSILKADLALSTYPRLVDIDAQRSMSENADFPDQEGQLSWEESQYLPTSDRPVFFGKDIFESKIFFESGLAYPIYSRLVSANRHINLAKVGIVAFLAIGTFGMLNAYEKFRKNYDFLMPVLGKVNSVLARIPRTPGETPMAEGLFDAQAKSLLDMMNHLQQTSFFSIFIPSSWFSPLHDQLNSSLKISYEQIVLRTIYMDLLLKARDVLNYRPDTRAREAKTTAFSILLLPTTTLEFQELKGYVDRVDLLCHNIEKYNALRNSADPSLLTDLVDYTFNMQLPAEFSASYQKFRKILQEAPYPPIDLKPYYPLAQNTLQGLYGRFLNVLFAPNDPQSFIGQLRYLTFAMGNSQTGQPVNLDLVRSLVTGIQQGLSQFGTMGKTWIDSPYFDPGPEFLEVIAKVNDNLAFGPVMVDQLARQTSAIYDAFHQEIMQINRLLVAPANVDPASVDLARPAAFSAGIFSIEQFLSKLFAQPFMTRSTNEMFVAQVPETKAVLWNQNLIDEAISLIKAYEAFTEKEMGSFPPDLREILRQIALQNLQQNITRSIARAQTFVDSYPPVATGEANEELIRTLTTNMKDTLPSFIKLLETLGKLQNGTVFTGLQNLLGVLSTRLLERIDFLLIFYAPYAVRDNNFDWWDGKSSVFLEGFAVRDSGELQAYLDHQRQLMVHLAKDYAQPLVNFLTSSVMNGFIGNRAVANRWGVIMDQLAQYDKKRPGNTVSILENFIGKDSLNLTMDNCFEKITLAEIKENSPDFFLNRRIQLKRALLARCEVTRRQTTIQNYEKLVTTFNESFRDKFPFVGENASQSQGEVDPDDLKTFFQLYHDFGDSPKAILEQVYQLGESAKEPYLFLKNMEEIKNFFQTFLNSPSPADVPTFDFTVDFRVNQENEKGGNMIIDWTLSPNDTTKILNTDKKKAGRWSYGSPVSVTFRWPDSSETQPFLDKGQPFMKVDEQTVIYTYPGQWSLFWVFRTQKASASDFATMQDTQPYTLRFEIPNGPEEKTIVFNRVTLRKPDKGKALGAVLEIPLFPTSAPDLNAKIQDMANKPVIAQGIVDPNPQFIADLENQAEVSQKNDTVSTPPAGSPNNDAPPADQPAADPAAAPEESPAQ